ncbi:MAG TPA: cation:dicarboxylase symporter family transporter [Candidatus Acidoferrales bacterium]|nr:cation:dicarboxylase symporter family transporter [Candidatus Acidoferrales bacterium]
MKNKLLISGLLLYLVAAVLAIGGRHGLATAPILGLLIRWAAVAALVAYAYLRRSLTAWILVFMALGAEAGADFPAMASHLRVLGDIFLRLIRVIIAPLLFATLVGGIAGHANLRQVGRMGVKAIVFFEVVTTIALFLGLAAIHVSKAGTGVHITAAAGAAHVAAARPAASEIILNIFPENIAKSVAENQVLQVVVFSILFGIALAMVPEEKRKPMLTFCDSLAEVMFKFTNIVMLFAPAGVGGAIAYTVAHTGFGVLYNLGELVATLYVSLFILLLGVLLPVAWLAHVPIRRFLRAVTEPTAIAFTTTSSEAALPSAMENMETFGVPRGMVAFVIPLGYSFNLTGTTLYLSMATIFVAQAAGIHLSWSRELVMMLMLMLASKGVAGVSRAAFIILLATSDQFGLPRDPVILLLGVDQLMDMGRTACNVIGNCLAAAVVARWEGELGGEKAGETTEAAVVR